MNINIKIFFKLRMISWFGQLSPLLRPLRSLLLQVLRIPPVSLVQTNIKTVLMDLKYKSKDSKHFVLQEVLFVFFSGYVRFDAPNYHTSFSFPVPKTRSNCLFQPLSAAFSCTERFSWFWSPAPGTFYLID